MKIISVDSSRCQGHGKCYALAPDLLEPGDDLGRAAVISGPIDASDAAKLSQGEAAIGACPEMALSWKDAEA
jgi:ferredoxin